MVCFCQIFFREVKYAELVLDWGPVLHCWKASKPILIYRECKNAVLHTLCSSVDLRSYHVSLLSLVFSLPQCRYLASLTWPDAPRIICFAAWTTGSGDHRWVAGGQDLIVWEQLPSSGRQRWERYSSTPLA